MQVILTKDVPKLGLKSDICDVKPGYFRNYLSPSRLAELPNSRNIIEAEKIMEERAKKAEELRKAAHDIKTTLEGVMLSFNKKTTKSGKTLYAAVHEKDIADAIKKEVSLEIDPKNIKIEKQIKSVGTHDIKIELAEGVAVDVQVKVEAEE